jgi:hypothetical protein
LCEQQFNPAQLHKRRLEILLTSETRFELSELRTFIIYSQVDRYSIQIASFGNDLYRENFFEFGFGFPVGKGFALGINVAGLNCWIKDISNHFTYSLKIGGQYENAPFLVGAWVNNVNVPRVSSIDHVPLSYSLLVDYQALPTLLFNFAIRGADTELPFYKFGLTFLPHKMLALVLGVNTKPLLLEYGLKLSLGKMFLSYSGNRHQQLGLTHNLGLAFRQ